jgi:hypothetical protein
LQQGPRRRVGPEASGGVAQPAHRLAASAVDDGAPLDACQRRFHGLDVALPHHVVPGGEHVLVLLRWQRLALLQQCQIPAGMPQRQAVG